MRLLVRPLAIRNAHQTEKNKKKNKKSYIEEKKYIKTN